MVFIWPWKGDDTSPASFEKTLSTLSTRITKTTRRLDILRQRSRRFNVVWTLYSSFAYLLYSIILAFVVGWRNWGLIEIGAVLGGPFLIYAVRLGLVSYYNYRISKVQFQLDDLQKQRDTTIEKLKAATKYNSTQELLKKYGGSPSPKTKPFGVSEGRAASKDDNSRISGGGRTSFIPPPTANIPGKSGLVSLPDTSQRFSPNRKAPQSRSPLTQNPPLSADSTVAPSHDSAEFAPNAFAAAPQYAQSKESPRWYDRLMDVILGDDESLPRNRLALICKKCRLVNGQAPPGFKRPEDVGKWRCGECGTMNGEETDTTKIIARIEEEVRAKTPRPISAEPIRSESEAEEMEFGDALAEASESEESDVTQYSEALSHEDEKTQLKALVPESTKEPETPRRKAGRPKGSKNKKT